jgi:2,4-dienoyl-CoA reductase-like NADH-dependent reductase (Old Yellow Enzyme family)
VEVAQQLNDQDKIDFLDISLWDAFKEPEEDNHKGRSLMSYFTELPRGNVKLGVAGKIRTPKDAEQIIAGGVDWIMLGRAAILHHDFPNRYKQDSKFEPVDTPVSRTYLAEEGLSQSFLAYMGQWPDFIAEES